MEFVYRDVVLIFGEEQLRQKNREILINKMYVGSFLSEGNNIGHEIINLYQADDGKNYIYWNPKGTIDLSHKDYEITVLMVRRFAANTYKILAKAEGINILDVANSKLSREARYQGQIELALTYGGVKLIDLFGENSFRGSIEEAKNSYVTFVADNILKPKKEIYITDDKKNEENNVFFIRTNKGFGKTTLREYYHEVEKPEAFVDLNKIIEDGNLWEEVNTTQKVSELHETQCDPYFNFLKIIKQEDNELVFSNMLAYFFEQRRELFVEFARYVLDLELEEHFIIEREKRNIDLLIYDEKNVVIIENKIKANVNGVNVRHNIYSNQIQSQLTKYYRYAVTDKEYQGKKVSCFIFSPNYNKIDLTRFISGDKYTVIYYKEIYTFFHENRKQFEGIAYFQEFINAMYKHTKDYDNELEEEMERRFQNTIASLQKTI